MNRPESPDINQTIRIWQIDNDGLKEFKQVNLDLESKLENWLIKDPSIISDDLLVIGSQIETGFGGSIDILCINQNGDLVIIELKRNKTPREVTAQSLDYASWVKDLSAKDIQDLSKNMDPSLQSRFKDKFNQDLPEILNENHEILIIGKEIDSATRRIVNYLSDTYGVPINAITFNFYENNDLNYLARSFLISPKDVENRTTKNKRVKLSDQELLKIASENGVEEIYKTLEEALSKHYPTKGRRASSVAFIDGNVHFSLIPLYSSRDQGLKFEVFWNRITEKFSITRETLRSFLPNLKSVYSNVDPIWDKEEGYFKTMDDAYKFINGVLNNNCENNKQIEEN